MASLPLTIKPRARKIRIEIDANRLERLAANLGMFHPKFLKSLDRAEKNYRARKVKKISSLRELRGK